VTHIRLPENSHKLTFPVGSADPLAGSGPAEGTTDKQEYVDPSKDASWLAAGWHRFIPSLNWCFYVLCDVSSKKHAPATVRIVVSTSRVSCGVTQN
jgi:hypothetical protein